VFDLRPAASPKLGVRTAGSESGGLSFPQAATCGLFSSSLNVN
jgi:hypothetical protein